jgi:anaphase-promoting complex subunit 1
MDLDNCADGGETVESVVRHVRATFEAGGAEDIIGVADDSFKRDVVVRKIHSLPIASRYSSPQRKRTKPEVYTLNDRHPQTDGEDRRIDIYIHEASSKEVVCLRVLVKYRPLFAELPHRQHIPIPIVVGDRKIGTSTDILKMNEDSMQAILLADRRILLSVYGDQMWPFPESPRYRRYDPFAIVPVDRTDTDIGRNRTLQPPARTMLQLRNAGINGKYDEVDEYGSHHRLQMQLRPSDRSIALLLNACERVLPTHHSQSLLGMWCDAHAWLKREPVRLVGTAEGVECAAFATTLLALAMPLIDMKARSALRVSRIAASNSSGSAEFALSKASHARRWSTRTAWSLFTQQAAKNEVLSSPGFSTKNTSPVRGDRLLVAGATLADEMLQTDRALQLPVLEPNEIMKIMVAMHIVSEEQKLCVLSTSSTRMDFLAPLIMQLGSWLGAANWTFGMCPYYDLSMDRPWTTVKATPLRQLSMSFMDEPVGVYHWFEHSLNVTSVERYPTLDLISTLESGTLPSRALQETARTITPRLAVLSDLVVSTSGFSSSAIETVEMMNHYGLTTEMTEMFPEAIAAPFRDAISRCEKDPPTTWPLSLLTLVGRDDHTTNGVRAVSPTSNASINAVTTPHDVQTICHTLDHPQHAARTKEAHRHAISQLIFNEDRRLVEATSLMHYNSAQVAECPKQPDWTDAQHLEQQRRVMQYVTTRMIALPAGDAMLHFDSQNILLTDKYYLAGFSNSCLMQPMGHTLTTDRSGLTEEKVNWAYFHAGASAGLRISRSVVGIDTSWIVFNKPTELTNRHAGLLLALGLTGHLRQLAKWLSFKYLTPKHSMTSVGLLLGLSASYMGSMDSLITRMLSVHITRMLPPGTAELNVSPITQTAGLVGIGLLYYNTQHRRMSEVMLSEVEHMEIEDPDAGPDPLRDESYRLAAGVALGYINLGRGKDLHGLHGMFLPERLLAVAVGPRPVSAVHVFDKATAGAVIAIALVYMKSGDNSVARKIDIPDTEAQFDHVRPDMLMLRAIAKHLILWDSIEVKSSKSGLPSWTQANLPPCFRNRFDEIGSSPGRHPLKSSDVPFFNVATGLAVALSLKYAGSGNMDARDEILTVLDYFYMVKGGAEAHYYDAKLTRSTVRRCIDVLALAAATVMAGTGDVRTFRYLRRLHGRTDAETPYGSHLAAHLAIGALFLGGGTLTFGTSDLAIASLICAFYPLFPVDVHDNHVHLQALRHFWVFAVEARCLVVEETDTKRPISMPIIATLRDGSTKSLTAPCLLPELDTIATVHTNNPAYWRVTLDFKNNPEHVLAFRKDQRIFVRRCPASEAHNSIFCATLAAMANVQTLSTQQIWHSIFGLPAFKELDKSSIELILPPDVHSMVANDEKGTVVDDKLVLSKAVSSSGRDALWNLRMLFGWAEKARNQGQGQLRWVGREVVEALKAKLEERSRQV